MFTGRVRCAPLLLLRVSLIAALVTIFAYFVAQSGTSLRKSGFLPPNEEPSPHAAEQCSYPTIDPFDPLIRDYTSVKNPPNSDCTQRESVAADAVHFRLLENRSWILTPAAGYSNCRQQCLGRRSDAQVRFPPWTPIGYGGALSECEFTNVRCENVTDLAYAHVIVDEALVNRREKSRKNGKVLSEAPNIILLIVDATSRQNAIRQLPKTRYHLLSRMRFVELETHAKHGHNSWPNAIALLTGMTIDELKNSTNGFHDECDTWPWIFQNFTRRHYATCFAIESSEDWNLCQRDPHAAGLIREPTTHNLRPFSIFAETQDLNPFCHGRKWKHRVMLDYAGEFLQRYAEAGVPTFAVVWLSAISHASISTLGFADDDIVDFFIQNRRIVDDSFVFFLSDHGHHFGSFRRTRVGRIEELWPFAFVSLPRRVDREFPVSFELLRRNAKRLTAQVDVYATMVDILHERYKRPQAKDFGDGRKHGLSLISHEISENRTCTEAGIPIQYCLCGDAEEKPIARNSSNALESARALLAHMNGMTEGFRNACVEWRLTEVVYASRRSLLMFESSVESFEYAILIAVRVNNLHMFEALVAKTNGTEARRVLGDALRLDSFRERSHCMPMTSLKPYCLCR